MGRIVQRETAGKDRKLMEKGIVAAIRELSKQSTLSETTYDLVAYIALSLITIGNAIDDSVVAWEKRGYWLKADRYRLQWSWTSVFGENLRNALLDEDWVNVAMIIAKVGEKMNHVEVSLKNRLGTPWIGAWSRLKRPDQRHN